MKTYWTFEYEEEIYDLECATEEAAYEFADEEFHQQMGEDGEHETIEREITLIEFHYNEDGERVIDWAKEDVLEFIYERSDYEEHGIGI